MNNTYRHVIVVGIDGAGAFIQQADTPCFDRIFARGAKTFDALASRPTISAECWGSMLLGVSPKVHGLTNGIVSSQPYPVDSPFPSLFRRIREVMPQAALGSFCDWNPITFGIVENNLNVTSATARDDALTPMICDYIAAEKPTFLFIQMDSVDGAGHGHGYGTEAHLKRISEVDVLLDRVYRAAEEAGMLEETLFCVIADHGGHDHGHGGWTDEEKYVTFAAAGKTVKAGEIGEMNIRDLAAIVLHALGIPSPEFSTEGWTSQIPADLFIEEVPAYQDISAETGALPRISRKAHTSELI